MNQEILTFNLAAKKPKNGWYWIAGAVAIVIASFFVQHIPFIEDVSGWRFVLLFLSQFILLIGVGILTVRQGVRVDTQDNTVKSWNGFLPFLKHRSVPINEFREVNITRTTVKGRNSTHVFHSIKLIGPDPHVLVWTDHDYSDVRAKAEQVATLLGLPLRDQSTEPIFREDGTPIAPRSPAALSHSLREQAVAQGEPPPFPVRPHDCRIKVTQSPSQTAFEMPPLNRSFLFPLAVAILALAFAAGLSLLIKAYTHPDDPLVTRLFLWAFPASIALIAPPFAIGRGINRSTQNETITLTPLALSRQRRQRWTSRSDDLALQLIEEFGYTPVAAAWAQMQDAGKRKNQPMKSAAISVRTDFKHISMGQGLRRSEQIWLHDALKYLLARAHE